MKVLVDTCVWSLSLRRRKGMTGLSDKEQRLVTALSEAVRDGRVVMVGPVRQELLSGINDAKQFKKLRSTLEAEDWYPNGYKVMQNGGKQYLDPSTGKPSLDECDTHVPLP